MGLKGRIWSALMVLVIMVCLFVPVGTARAWEQPTHSQINFEAGRVFLRKYASSGMDKYRLGRFSQQSLKEQYRGIAVESRSALIDPWRGADLVFDAYKIGERSLTLSQWVFYGGDWADEPHLYASVRHFYDPWSLWGQPYLTDQYEFHGWYDDPQIDARTWALDHPDNPFSFESALFYYKAAMETPEEPLTSEPRLTSGHWKLNLNLAPRDAADQRSIHLAMAYRALGETMHLLGDMTQPAHVRNDAHAYSEPIEEAVKRATVREAAANPVVDPHIARFVHSAGGELQAPADLFRQVAIFTNHYFYSADTIYDEGEGVMPQNIGRVSSAMGDKHPYQFPQFDDLVAEEVMVTTSRGEVRAAKRLHAPLINDRISMAQERLSYHWFDPDMTTVEKIARETMLAPYHIPPSFAKDQARVLMPVAIYACADLMHLFFPTLELKAEYDDLGVVEEEIEGREEYGRQVVEIDTEMVHRQSEDVAWSDYGLSIDYSGPAQLVFARGDEILKTRELHFVDGQLEKIEDHEGRMVEEPLRVFVAEPGIPLTEEEAFYEVEKQEKTTIYMQIEGGSRTFKSPAFEFEPEEEAEVSIQPPRLLILELAQGATEAEHQFEAVASPDGAYRFEWDFDDGETFDEVKEAGESSRVSHMYVDLQGGEVFRPSVKLYNEEGDFLAEDQISIEVGAGGQWSKMTVQVPPGLDREHEGSECLETSLSDYPDGVKSVLTIRGSRLSLDHMSTRIDFRGWLREDEFEYEEQLAEWEKTEYLVSTRAEDLPADRDVEFTSGDVNLGALSGKYASYTTQYGDESNQHHGWSYEADLYSRNALFKLVVGVTARGDPGDATTRGFEQAVQEAQDIIQGLQVELSQ